MTDKNVPGSSSGMSWYTKKLLQNTAYIFCIRSILQQPVPNTVFCEFFTYDTAHQL